MKTETTKEQTKRLIQLGCQQPDEVDNWILDMLTQDHLSYYDEDSCIRVLKNYTIGEVLKYFISVLSHYFISKHRCCGCCGKGSVKIPFVIDFNLDISHFDY